MTTPTSALELLTCTPPVAERIKSKAVKGYLVVGGVIGLDKTKAIYATNNRFEVRIDRRAEWENRRPQTAMPKPSHAILMDPSCLTEGRALLSLSRTLAKRWKSRST